MLLGCACVCGGGDVGHVARVMCQMHAGVLVKQSSHSPTPGICSAKTQFSPSYPCFSAGVYCSGCACLDCLNTLASQDAVMQERQRILQRSPRAFDPKVRLAVCMCARVCA